MMGYLFLTGATGLLGSYLIRDLTRAGVNLAILARSTRFETAQQRVENLVAHWEQSSAHALPRPVVIEGDLSQPNLGLDANWQTWVAENCTALMHNAASLTFHAEEPDGEPWRSNLHGTQHVLNVCKAAGIREFHHVSTAYVCGERQDTILESELDVGQKHGNDYEVSKFRAEQLVRGADFLDSVTVYRPGIILGDSQTGYTSTFHGFYVPLKLVSTLINKIPLGASREMVTAGVRLASERLREILHLEGHEAKNFMPVDWCAAVMSHIYTNRELHQNTYHLTPRERVPIRLVQDVMEEAFLKYTDFTSEQANEDFDWGEFEKFFVEGMSVYRNYWKDDPTFDTTNTTAAAPHLPCPELDAVTIMKMCRFAIETNFGWPRKIPSLPEFDVQKQLADLASAPGGTNGRQIHLGLQVNGRGGGQWELALEDGRIHSAVPGVSSKCTATYYLNSATLQRMCRQETSAEAAVNTGRVVIEGNGVPYPELVQTLDKLARTMAGGGPGSSS